MADQADQGSAASPKLSDEQLARLRSYGSPEQVEVGELVFAAGDPVYDLVVVESGAIEVVREATRDAPEETLVRHGPGAFLGELNMLTGQTVYLSGRVAEAGRVQRISPANFRRLMADDPELSDLLLQAFLARREMLRKGSAARLLEIVGSEMDAAALALRTYAARRLLPHLWFDADSVAGHSLMRAASLESGDLPAVLTPRRTLLRATPGELAEHLGLAYKGGGDKPVDLAVVGAGPAGLAAAVYGASEGLETVLLDAIGPGGQAASSSRIENYLGFPTGLSGDELARRAVVQAMKFGARLSSPCEIASLETGGHRLAAVLADGTEIITRAVIVAAGARYKALPLEGWEELAGAGIYYAATELEARSCSERPVTVVGGANSAGQAALFLAARGASVTLAIRGPEIGAKMSRYLVDRVLADPRIEVRTSTAVTGLDGESHLEGVTLTERSSGAEESRPCHGLFCFIGAEPATAWLDGGVCLDEKGFVLTDVQLENEHLGETWATLGRVPLPFETSVPAVFAAGDVRRGSMKRVAAAVGEGASAVRSVHAAVGVVA